jgi:inorganic phosphate transporter, PiT family
MGIIVSLLLSVQMIDSAEPPLWVIIGAYTAIALGTMTGGWKIVKTMGTKLVKLRPIDGFSAETASAITLFTASSFGVPISTTQSIT